MLRYINLGWLRLVSFGFLHAVKGCFSLDYFELRYSSCEREMLTLESFAMLADGFPVSGEVIC
jgi:hypothetical protein